MFLWAATTVLPLSTAARNFGQQIEREDSMKVDLEFEFDAEELASIPVIAVKRVPARQRFAHSYERP